MTEELRPDVISPGRVAVVTGAASGIGFGLAERFAAEGMRVVMADVEGPALERAAAQLARRGGEVLAVVTDVSKSEQVEALAARTVDAFTAVHLVCNNAGVRGLHDPLWTIPESYWEWVLGVDLWGVIHGVRVFLPLLLEQDVAHVVNTSSVFGIFAGARGPYGISKHAVTALTETLYFNLQEAGAQVGVSVLCPGAVRTNFASSARNQPAHLPPPPEGRDVKLAASYKEQFDRLAAGGLEPSEVADIVVNGIRSGRFYILTSSNRNDAVRRRGEEIVRGAPPEPPFPPPTQ